VIVQRLHSRPEDPDHIAARQEFYLIEKQYEMDKTIQVRPFEIFRSKANRYRTLVACLLMFGGKILKLAISMAVADQAKTSFLVFML